MLVKPIFTMLKKLSDNDVFQNILFWTIIVLIFVGCNRHSENIDKHISNTNTPETVVVDLDDLKDLQELADDRSRNYGEILDDLSDKVTEMIDYALTEQEVLKEENEEKRIELLQESQW